MQTQRDCEEVAKTSGERERPRGPRGGGAQEEGGTKRPGPTDLEKAGALQREQKPGESERVRERARIAGDLGRVGREDPAPPPRRVGRPPGQGSERRVLSQGHACRGAGPRGRREGCGRQQDPRAGRTGVGGSRESDLDPEPPTLP